MKKKKEKKQLKTNITTSTESTKHLFTNLFHRAIFRAHKSQEFMSNDFKQTNLCSRENCAEVLYRKILFGAV